jgi:hypothetical protein
MVRSEVRENSKPLNKYEVTDLNARLKFRDLAGDSESNELGAADQTLLWQPKLHLVNAVGQVPSGKWCCATPKLIK